MAIRWAPRLSLFGALLLMTIVGLSVALWRNGQRLLPLQWEIARLRKEVGALEIGDPNRVYIRNDQTAAPLLWRRRIYVPPEKQYALLCAYGKLPYQGDASFGQWVRSPNVTARRFASELSIGAEAALEIGLTPLENTNLQIVQPPNGVVADQWFSVDQNWLADDRVRLRKDENAHDYGTVRDYAPDAAIVLLHLERGKLKERDGNWYVEESAAPTEHLIVWIEPIASPASGAMQTTRVRTTQSTGGSD